MLMSTVVGIKNIDPAQRALLQSFAATRWQVFRRLELPGALPVLIGGLKISMILAVAGAVVAESVTPLGGIGSLLNAARSRYDSPLAFVSVIALTIFALILYGLVNLAERRLLGWKQV
jgi:ABC-type nitrate/sulfonate/bicarbonate transport system permease component